MCNLKSDRMISAHFQDKPFSIRVYAPNSNVIEVYAPKTNIDEDEAEWFYEDIKDLLELIPKKKKRCPFHHRGLECKSGKSRDTWSNRKVWPWSTK